MESIKTGNFIACSEHGLVKIMTDMQPWVVVSRLAKIIESLISDLNPNEYSINGKQAIHKNAVIEAGAQLKGPIIIGPNLFYSQR